MSSLSTGIKNTTEAINSTNAEISSKLNDLNTLEMTDRFQLQLDSIERDRLLTTFTEIITSKKTDCNVITK